MSNLADIRRERDMRRLNCAIHQASLHADGLEHEWLIALKHDVRLDRFPLDDAIRAVNAMRTRQRAAA